MHIGGQIYNAVWRVQMCIYYQMKRSKRDTAHSSIEKLLPKSFLQLAICLSLSCFTLFTIFRDACILAVRSAWHLASTNVHLRSNGVFQT